MISFQQALEILNKNVTPLPAEQIDLPDAAGRVLAEDIYARLDLPHFTNSAMDGFAVKYEDLIHASPQTPVTLPCTGQSAAGDVRTEASFGPTAGACWEIMTGAILPSTCDTIVPVEQVQKQDEHITFTACPTLGAHVRHVGEDVQRDEHVLSAGIRLEPQHISLLAALGLAHVQVIRRPRVAVLTTGNEVVVDLAQPLQTGQIYNSSLYYLMTALPRFGAEVIFQATLKDDNDAALATFQQALAQEPDLILTTGAVSMGRYDFIPDVLKKLNATIHFHKIAQRPGKPVLAAQLTNQTWCIGLPGNPVSTMSSLRFIAGHILRKLQNMPEELPLHLPLHNNITSKLGLVHFQKAMLHHTHDGRTTVEALAGQASFMQKPMTMMDSWLVVPAEHEKMHAGDMVEVYPAF